MRKLNVFLCLLALLCASAAVSLAAGLSLYVQPAGEDPASRSAAAVDIYKKNSKDWYLYLPAGMDASALRVVYTGASSVTVDGSELVSGEVTDVLQPSASSRKLKADGKSANLYVLQSANIHAVFLTTESGTTKHIETSKDVHEKGTFALLSPEGEILMDQPLEHVKGRGNGSYQYAKKSFQIKFTKKTDVLEMGKAKKWILLASYQDISLMRNRIAYDTALEAGLNYAVESRFVDLYINGNYRGNYLLCEKVEIGKNRIDIFDLESATEAVNEKPLSEYKRIGRKSADAGTYKAYDIPNDPEDITGGYLLEFDMASRYSAEASGVVTKAGQPIVIKEPKYVTEAQAKYVYNMMQSIENAINAKDGIDPVTGKHFTELIDMDSFVRAALVNETLKNYDAVRTSLFFYKPLDSVSTKLYAAPIWDFDQSIENYGSKGVSFMTTLQSSVSWRWYPTLYRKQPEFRQAVAKYYREIFSNCLAILTGEADQGRYLRSIDSYLEEIDASAAMNYRRWHAVQVPRYSYMGSTYRIQAGKMTTFLSRRRAWLDKIMAGD